MTEGEVCPDGAKIVRNQVMTASLRSVPRFIQRNTRSWFPYGICPAIIGAEFGNHLGNVGGMARIEDFRIHDLRHTHASIAVMSGTSLPLVGKASGHTQLRTTERYAHVADDPARAVADVVAEWLRDL